MLLTTDRILLCIYVLQESTNFFALAVAPSEDEIKQLPDLNKKETRKELRCSACRAVTLEIFEAFVKVDLNHMGNFFYVWISIGITGTRNALCN